MKRGAQYQILEGSATPLGVSISKKGVNFSLFSEHATAVFLCLFTPHEAHPFLEIPMHPSPYKTGQVWHALISGLPQTLEYAYRLKGPFIPEKGLLFDSSKIVSDPYTKALSTPHQWGKSGSSEKKSVPRGRLFPTRLFDWENVVSPHIPIQDLIIYEMHVRSFTQHPSSHSAHPGTFLGIIEKIPYLKSLGVNAVELMPIHEFDETEYHKKNPKTGSLLFNYWGYSTINFFCPMNRYGSKAAFEGPIEEFKMMVKELHRNQIEVILDVVFNHTAEGPLNGPTFSFRGIDNSTYYILDENGGYKDYSGCGNTFNCNHPIPHDLIVESLKYWVQEMHVDGFRFDLASILTRDQQGEPLTSPPVVEMIVKDPLLSNTKLIAEAWDAGGLYQVGSFPAFSRWAEWNGKYRDVVRRFIKGTDQQAGEFAKAITGSQDLYGVDRDPYHSVNFVTAHDGFTLKDLVSYQEKHNEENGEENRDGSSNNDSWNCGHEGETKNHAVQLIRARQMRNFHLALMLSLGVPMLLMGDEYGHTRRGNNNAWCQDNELNWFLWDEIKQQKDFFRFYKLVNHLRKKEPLLRRTSFLTNDDVDWHGHQPLNPDWDSQSRFVAFTLKDHLYAKHLYVAFNAHYESAHITLSLPPPSKKWYRIIDTSLPSPDDFLEDPHSQPPLKHTYTLLPYSALLAYAL